MNNFAYFGTAGFGGSEQYYAQLFEITKAYIDDSDEILGYFYCQVKMPASVRTRYEKMLEAKPNDVKLQAAIQNFDCALEHPNEKERKEVCVWANEILAKLI